MSDSRFVKELEVTRTSKHTPPGHGDTFSIGDDELHPVVPGANAHTLVMVGGGGVHWEHFSRADFWAECLSDDVAEFEFTVMPGGIRHE